MRTPIDASAYGPANLLVAIDQRSRNKSVLVVMNDTIHSPYWVQKSHTIKVEIFQSGPAGTLGIILEGNFFTLIPNFSQQLSSVLTIMTTK
ncbi:hypothetical protein H710_00107 [Bartonella bacilliformis Ver097]|uniref:L-asparaginase N-terminal domain-containing protein n=1 Tax=Bartonella bacilliformis Ver097 TaxID=1293911 RepID=A0A072R611_BARBA|nr:hypothetical protein H710_00107 [Bartonella bacilliformis Ver097]